MLKNAIRRVVSIVLVSVLLLQLVVAISPGMQAEAASRPQYVAHRGLSARAPENTLASFKLATKKKGFYAIEFDIWEAKSKAGEDPLLLVMHDENTRSMCNKSSKVRSISRKTLKNYTITKGNNVKKYKNQKIPTVEQVLDLIWESETKAIPMIELKHRLSPKALKYLLTYLGDHKAVIISFEFGAVADTVKMAKKMGIEDNISTIYLAKRVSPKKINATAKKMKKAGIKSISMKYTYVNKSTVKAFHKKGISVGVWTLPNKKTARRYVRMGVDCLSGNDVLF